MFKRRHDYLMQMDIEVSEDLVAGALELFRGKYPDAEIREMAIDSLMRHVLSACEAALRENGQKLKGAEFEHEGEWPTFQVAFQGDTEGATRAANAWIVKVGDLNGARRVLRLGLQGADGTNTQYMNPELEGEYAELFESLSPAAQSEIDRLMDPESDR